MDSISELEYSQSVSLGKKISFKQPAQTGEDALERMFERACQIAVSQTKGSKAAHLQNFSTVGIGIDIVCYGAYNSKMVGVFTHSDSNKVKAEMVEHHIGHLKVLPKYNEAQVRFIEVFNALVSVTFHCFGKRWYELNKQERTCSSSLPFKIVERNQFACLYFAEQQSTYSMNTVVSVFFRTMLACVGLNRTNWDTKLTNLCVTVPSDFHTYQRLALKNCFESIELTKYKVVNKSTALALPFLTNDKSDSKEKFVIDFGSGYMNCSILKMNKDKTLLSVVDQLSARDISSRDFFEQCFDTLMRQVPHNMTGLIHRSRLRRALYKSMNRDENPMRSEMKEVWAIPISDNQKVNINMKSMGALVLACQVIERLRETYMITLETGRISDVITNILICSDAVIYEYLEPMLRKYCAPKTRIVFVDNDCASLSAAYLASGHLGISTQEMLPFPISMGIYNGVVKRLIDARTSFPCSGKHVFSTIMDNQKLIRVNVYEGESPLARNCKHICEVIVDGLDQSRQNRIKLELIVEFDEHGVLTCSAYDCRSREQPLNTVIDYHTLRYCRFERLANEHVVCIDRRVDALEMNRDRNLARLLQDLNYFCEYLLFFYKRSKEVNADALDTKIILAKKYMSKNRLRIKEEDCVQLSNELQEIALKMKLELNFSDLMAKSRKYGKGRFNYDDFTYDSMKERCSIL